MRMLRRERGQIERDALLHAIQLLGHNFSYLLFQVILN
jgi:hypothetical protein